MKRSDMIDRDDSRNANELEAPAFEGVRLAYIKTIGLDQAKAMGLVIPSEIKLPDNTMLFALHAADGRTLGISDNWAAAYGAAVQNNLLPLSVH